MTYPSETIQTIEGLAPDADALAGTVTSRAVNLGLAESAIFKVHRGVGTSGTQTLTLQASAASDKASPTAIPFRYRRIDTYTGGDDPGAAAAATSAGFTTAAGGSDIYLIEVKASELPEAKPWVHLKSVEVADAAVDAGILIDLVGVRYQQNSMPSVIS